MPWKHGGVAQRTLDDDVVLWRKLHWASKLPFDHELFGLEVS